MSKLQSVSILEKELIFLIDIQAFTPAQHGDITA